VTGTAHAAGPLWVSVEGINGVGKTSASRAAAAAFGARAVLLDELTDQANDTLSETVIAALSSNGDPFLRTGHPVVETLALLALQVRKSERLAGRDLTGVDVIIEDRGVDSVAVYQAAVLCAEHPLTTPHEIARRILSDAHRWRGLPDATLLLTGDPTVCARRFADRIGRPLAPADTALLAEIDRLYRATAMDDPGRYVILDVARLTLRESTDAIRKAVDGLLNRQVTVVMKGPTA
jgi:dTMP kinase